ncbi:hypothetical protein HQO12_04575 [Rhodococcus fascians]|uniref:hypothetical protein n=1 Tax=Rhodococcoides fascians TaxID=1828 RepID=UPI00195D8ACD|nr:hypothetical protein [Rhodococcus fascians]MBM7241989.1 hypothetical protein [Rhodococcus fascians]MBY3808693.1 hypothetical protein [Rhodococcus fascians]MBY3840137.1 hypothetical protein [Rhodococcus fascians]MBY3845098.1 hypothetical protein [Rhodococcus fascians]MBY3848662.1 hypothetical protein [Rhodococcus fascians]
MTDPGHGPGGTHLYRRLVTRSDGPLSPVRAARRLSAYIYGNILVLAAVAASTPSSIGHGTAAVLVAATAATTFLAHVFADFVAGSQIPEAHGDATDEQRTFEAIEEFRDAVPILSSGTFPAAMLALGWLSVLPAQWAELLAGAVIVVRIATIPIVTERVRGNRPTFRALVIGLATAVVAALIVLAKVFLGH